MNSMFRYTLYRVIFPIVIGLLYTEVLTIIFNENNKGWKGILIGILNDKPYGYINVATIGNYKICINEFLINHKIALLIYLTFSWIAGMLAAFIAEIFVFSLPFSMNLFNRERIENVSPYEDGNGNGNGNENENGNENFYIKFNHFNLTESLVEFSEINYVLSNFFASLFILSLIFFIKNFKNIFKDNILIVIVVLPIFLNILPIIFVRLKEIKSTILKCLKKIQFIVYFSSSILLLVSFLISSQPYKLYSFISFIASSSLILSIRFRTFANKILYYNQSNNQNNQTNNQNNQN